MDQQVLSASLDKNRRRGRCRRSLNTDLASRIEICPLLNDWGVISVDNWAEIRRLHLGERLSIKAIAHPLGISRNTVKRALAPDDPPRYRRAAKGSAVNAFKPGIRALLTEFPDMPATVIAKRVSWTRSISVFRPRVSQLRPWSMPTDPASPTTYATGELVQCDSLFSLVEIPVGFGQITRLPVLTMTSGSSQLLAALMIPSRQAEDLLSRHWKIFTSWRAVPKTLVWDGEAALSSRRGRRVKLSQEFESVRGTLKVKVDLQTQGHEAKVLVQRFNDYSGTSFLPGRCLASPNNFNHQVHAWITSKAMLSMHRTLSCRPINRLKADKAAMLDLSPITAHQGWVSSIRLPRGHYVRVGSNDYSVDPTAIGRRVQVSSDLQNVTITWGERIVGRHRMNRGKHQIINNPVHFEAAARMRPRPTLGP